MKQELQAFMLISNNQHEFHIENSRYVLNQAAAYPLCSMLMENVQRENQIKVKVLESRQDGQIDGWLYNGVISALYTSGQFDIGGSADPNILINLLQETGKNSNSVLHGKNFPDLLKQFPTVERMLEFRTPEYKEKKAGKLKKIKNILLHKEMGKHLSKEEQEFLAKNKAEFEFNQKPAAEKMSEIEDMLKDSATVWEAFKRKVSDNPALLKEATSSIQLLADTILEFEIKPPLPDMVITIDNQRKLERI